MYIGLNTKLMIFVYYYFQRKSLCISKSNLQIVKKSFFIKMENIKLDKNCLNN